MSRSRQQQMDIEAGPRARVWCRGVDCGRELTDKISRLRGLGPECDPEPRTGYAQFDIDQDPIPGM